MKLKWHLRLKGSNISSPPESNVSSPETNTSKVQENKTIHLSLHHEKVEAKRMEAKKREIEEAIALTTIVRDTKHVFLKPTTHQRRAYNQPTS